MSPVRCAVVLLLVLLAAPLPARAQDEGQTWPVAFFGTIWAVGNPALAAGNGLCIAGAESCDRGRIRWLVGGAAVATGAIGVLFGVEILTDDTLNGAGWRTLGVADLATGAAALIAGSLNLALPHRAQSALSVVPVGNGLALVGRF